jgi:hypothetical protein
MVVVVVVAAIATKWTTRINQLYISVPTLTWT